VKLLFINEKCGYFGGLEQNVADVAAGLRARGHECVLAYGSTTFQDTAGYRSRFDDCVPWAPGDSGDSPGSCPDLEYLVAATHPDVIYIHKTPTLPELSAAGGTRTVRMVHDHDLCCPRQRKYFAWSGKVCRLPVGWRCWADLAFLKRGRAFPMLLDTGSVARTRSDLVRHRHLDALIVASRFMRDEMTRNGIPREAIHILPPVPVDTRDLLRDIPEEPHLLFVGQLIRGKGVDLLLRALARLTTPFRATVVGDGNAAGSLRKMARRLGLTGRVEFLGWVAHEDLGRHYDSARVVVVPSRWPEPFGLVGIEAMRRARPVVAFDVGGIPDWLKDGETGLLCPEQDVSALALALRRLLVDRELASRLGRAGYERAQRVYSHQGYIQDLETLLTGATPPVRDTSG
jgi:glycosyltransferase involved in cell wall biosynthesis